MKKTNKWLLAVSCALGLTTVSTVAQAYWHHGHWYGPRYYYSSPSYYYYGYGGYHYRHGYNYMHCRWAPGHWVYGRWVPAHRVCWR